MAQSAEQREAITRLGTECGLTESDWNQHKQSKDWLISRTGIEKIQYKHGITVEYVPVRCEPDFAAVKAIAIRKVKVEGAKTATTLKVESFGSACKGNCAPTFNYFLEMAEKRAKSRVVLMLAGFYELGVYGEDEMPPADAPRPQQAGNAPAAPATASPAPSTTSAPSAAAPAPSAGLSDRNRIGLVRISQTLELPADLRAQAQRILAKGERGEATAADNQAAIEMRYQAAALLPAPADVATQ